MLDALKNGFSDVSHFTDEASEAGDDEVSDESQGILGVSRLCGFKTCILNSCGPGEGREERGALEDSPHLPTS